VKSISIKYYLPSSDELDGGDKILEIPVIIKMKQISNNKKQNKP
jgi:hypothetical protein